MAARRAAASPTGDVTAPPLPLGGRNPMTFHSVRSQPGILLSGSPPSDPLRSLKRATRFIISARDNVILGSVSISVLHALARLLQPLLTAVNCPTSRG